MNDIKNKKNIRFWQLPILIILLGGIVCGLFVFMSEANLRNSYQDENKKVLSLVLDKTSHSLSLWQKNNISAIQQLSQNDSTKKFWLELHKISSSNNTEELKQSPALTALRHEMGKWLSNRGHNGFFFVTLEGKNIGSMRDTNLGQHSILFKNEEVITKVLNGQTVITHPMRSDVQLYSSSAQNDNDTTMFAITPINIEQKIVGILGIRIDPLKEFSPIFQSGRTGLTGETYAFNKDGDMLSETRFYEHLVDAALLSTGQNSTLNIKIKDPLIDLTQSEPQKLNPDDLSLTLMAREATTKKHGMNLEGYRDYRGIPVLGIWKWDPVMDFGFTFEIDKAEATKSYNIAIQYIYFGGSAAFILITLLSLLLFYTQKNNYEKNQKISESIEKEKKAIAAKSEFLANMSHEIRTPLNGIIGASRLIEVEHLSESQATLIEIIIKSGKSLLSIVNEILDFSKIEAGMLSIDDEIFNAHDCLQDVISLFQPVASKKGLLLETIIAKDFPEYIEADQGRIRQIVTNLISNALKFTEDGSVKLIAEAVSCNDEKQTIKITIEDTGIGIDTKQINTLFDAFTQADSSSIRKAGGTGLGLTISKQLCELMGGEINVTSTPNVGSKFTAFLTVSIPSAQNIEKFKETFSKPTSNILENYQYNGSILVVEDTIANQYVIRAIFEKLNCNIDIANNGLEGLEMARSKTYDIIFMDCQMPVMSGYESSRKIRETDKKTPIIALTAHAFQEAIDQCLESGMSGHLSKPIIQEELISTLEEWTPDNLVILSDKAYAPQVIEDDQLTIDKKTLKHNIIELGDDFITIAINDINKILGTLDNFTKNNDLYQIQQQAHNLSSVSLYLGSTKINQLSKKLENMDSLSEAKEILQTIKSIYPQLKMSVEEEIKAAQKKNTA